MVRRSQHGTTFDSWHLQVLMNLRVTMQQWHALFFFFFKQICDVQPWKQVRGPAGAVMCETLAILLFEEQVVVDVRVVCPATREEHASATGQVGSLEDIDSKARVWGAEWSVAGANPSYAAQERPTKRGQTGTAM